MLCSGRQELRSLQLHQWIEQSDRTVSRTVSRCSKGYSSVRGTRRWIGSPTEGEARWTRRETRSSNGAGGWIRREDSRDEKNSRSMPSRFSWSSFVSPSIWTCRAARFVGIQSLFKKIGCDRQQIDHLLQSHEGVTEENMLKYMGIIEERANELLTAQATIQAKVIRFTSSPRETFPRLYSGTKHPVTWTSTESDRRWSIGTSTSRSNSPSKHPGVSSTI